MASKAIGFLNFKFGADLKGFDRAMKKAQKNLKKFGKNIQRTGENLTTGLTLPIVGLGAASLKLASDFEQTDSKFKTVFSSIQAEAEQTAKVFSESFGLSDLAAKKLLSDTGDLLVGFGFTEQSALDLSKQVNELAVDLASFTNFSGGAEGASAALTKALLGERESIKSLGIAITEADLKEFAAQHGLVFKELDRVAKAQLTYQLALKQSSKAVGDFERTSHTFANQMRIAKAELTDAAISLGEHLIPMAQKAIRFFRELVDKFNSLSASTKKSIVNWALLIAAIGPILIIIGKISVGISSLIPLFGKLAATNPYILAIVGAIAFVKILEKVINRLNNQFSIQKQIEKVNAQARQNISEDLTKIKVSTSLLVDENTTLEHKKKLLDDLKKTYPGYYDELDEATLSTQTLTQANDNLINSLLKASQVEALKGRLTDIQKEILAAQQDIGTSSVFGFDLDNFVSNVPLPLQMLLKTLSTKTGIEGIGNLNKEAEALTNMLTKLIVETEDANEEFKKLDHTTTNLSINTKTTTEKTEKYSRSLDPLIENIKKYSEAYKVLGADMQDVDFFTLKLTESQKLAKAGFMMFGDVLTSSLDSALNSQEKFFDVFIKNIKRAITSLMVQLAVMTLISAIMPASLGGIGKAAFSSKNILGNLGKIMGFADGGLVTGPTVGLIGEGIGTTASNPEVIAPLDKLKNFIGGGSQNVIVEGVIKGNDIFLSNRNTGTNRQRSV